MKKITAAKAGKSLKDLIRKVTTGYQEPLVISGGKGQEAVLVSMETFEDMMRAIALLSIMESEEDADEFEGIAGTQALKEVEIQPLDQRFKQVYQFKVTIKGVKPPIWRRIQVPENYTFWDLHVAIQDAMGWRDMHLHEYDVKHPETGEMTRIGIPDEDFDMAGDVRESWNCLIKDYFSPENPRAAYTYDFGDNWQHTVMFEKILLRVKDKTYPQCIKGKRACPPEDCGGVWGYDSIVEKLGDPSGEGQQEIHEWLGCPYDANRFGIEQIEFEDPRGRLELFLEMNT